MVSHVGAHQPGIGIDSDGSNVIDEIGFVGLPVRQVSVGVIGRLDNRDALIDELAALSIDRRHLFVDDFHRALQTVDLAIVLLQGRALGSGDRHCQHRQDREELPSHLHIRHRELHFSGGAKT